MLLSGCGTTEDRSPIAPPPTARPIAVINGQATAAPTIDSALREAAGRRVLQDIILDRALTERCKAQGIEITNAMIQGVSSCAFDIWKMMSAFFLDLHFLSLKK